MENKDYVSPIIAEILKEKKFNVPCEKKINLNTKCWCYCGYDHLKEGNDVLEPYFASYPTLYEVQKWFRENHNLHITIDRNASGYYWCICKADNGTFIENYDWSGPNDGGDWDSYEEALEAAIFRALSLI